MASAVTTPPPVMGDGRTHPEKLSLIDRLKKGDEIALSRHLRFGVQHRSDHMFAGAASVGGFRRRPPRLWLEFLETSTDWDPVNDQFGALPFIYGTVLTSLLALLMAVPVGLRAAIFLAELAPRRVSNALTFMIELLAAVPSVIYGLLGIFMMLPILRDYVVPVLQTLVWVSADLQGRVLWRELLFGGVHPGDHDCAVYCVRSRARCCWPFRRRSAKR